MPKISLASLPVALVVALSLWNAGFSLVHYYRWPVAITDDWEPFRLERNLAYARTVLGKLPDAHIEYRVEEASDTYDQGAYLRLQYVLCPSILQQYPATDGYVLVEFWTSRKVKPLPGLKLVDDLGQGLSLYRRQ